MVEGKGMMNATQAAEPMLDDKAARPLPHDGHMRLWLAVVAATALTGLCILEIILIGCDANILLLRFLALAFILRLVAHWRNRAIRISAMDRWAAPLLIVAGGILSNIMWQRPDGVSLFILFLANALTICCLLPWLTGMAVPQAAPPAAGQAKELPLRREGDAAGKTDTKIPMVPLPLVALRLEMAQACLSQVVSSLTYLAGTRQGGQATQIGQALASLAAAQELLCPYDAPLSPRPSSQSVTLDQPAASERSPLAPLAVAKGAIRVLLVDDDAAGRTWLAGLLERQGVAVDVVDDCRLALEIVRLSRPDWAVVAVSPLRLRGLALAFLLTRLSDCRIALVHGQGLRPSARSLRRLDNPLTLQKPLTLADLAPLLQRSPPTSAPPILDVGTLDEHQRALGQARVRRIVDAFLINSPATVNLCLTALADKDAEALGKAAHKLAGAAVATGALRLAEVAHVVDDAIRHKDHEVAFRGADRLAAAYASAAGALIAYRRDRLAHSA
jgi:HPt (histidine-containing phosphotransfer) domain-containing protein/CheY-like chemotaxis protein